MTITLTDFQKFAGDYRKNIEIPKLQNMEKAGAAVSITSFAVAIILALGIAWIIAGSINGFIGGAAAAGVVFFIAIALVVYARMQQKATPSTHELENRMLLGILHKPNIQNLTEAVAVESPDHQHVTVYTISKNNKVLSQTRGADAAHGETFIGSDMIKERISGRIA